MIPPFNLQSQSHFHLLTMIIKKTPKKILEQYYQGKMHERIKRDRLELENVLTEEQKEDIRLSKMKSRIGKRRILFGSKPFGKLTPAKKKRLIRIRDIENIIEIKRNKPLLNQIAKEFYPKVKCFMLESDKEEKLTLAQAKILVANGIFVGLNIRSVRSRLFYLEDKEFYIENFDIKSCNLNIQLDKS